MKKFFKWLKKYFIPHEHNDFKPHFFRRESMLLSFLIIIFIELAFLTQVFVIFDKTNFLAAVLPGVLTSITNDERADNGASPLVENDLLTKAAQMKAEDMAALEYFAHTSPEGKTPWYWFDQVGYRYSSAGENLAVNFFESSDVAEAWMNSPSHRENIVKKNYTEIGIGVADGVYQGRNTVFVAQLFGTPLPTYTSPPTTVATETTPVESPAPATTPKPAPVTPKPPKTTAPSVPEPVPPVVTPPTQIAVAPTAIQVLGEETAPVKMAETVQSEVKSFVGKALTSPREYVTYVYGGIALLIVVALLLALFIRSERSHPLIIARGVGLVAIIVFLLFANLKALHLDTEISPGGLSASVIAY